MKLKNKELLPELRTRHLSETGLRGDENLTAQISEAVEPSKGLLFTEKKKLLPIRLYDVNTKFESPTTEKGSMKYL
jgi:hypothetical protein